MCFAAFRCFAESFLQLFQCAVAAFRCFAESFLQLFQCAVAACTQERFCLEQKKDNWKRHYNTWAASHEAVRAHLRSEHGPFAQYPITTLGGSRVAAANRFAFTLDQQLSIMMTFQKDDAWDADGLPHSVDCITALGVLTLWATSGQKPRTPRADKFLYGPLLAKWSDRRSAEANPEVAAQLPAALDSTDDPVKARPRTTKRNAAVIVNDEQKLELSLQYDMIMDEYLHYVSMVKKMKAAQKHTQAKMMNLNICMKAAKAPVRTVVTCYMLL